eukprot:TRINITY_DN75187_c0_g1_i1.p1 TRINITY_DN75187_c0_g1~~TRINITY_DN75187_c0_g1_i1.p1  ORF type:complete len:542 (-),score=95.78 TRINITY_DN75187_c0_g1_i1:402-2027(-)
MVDRESDSDEPNVAMRLGSKEIMSTRAEAGRLLDRPGSGTVIFERDLGTENEFDSSEDEVFSKAVNFCRRPLVIVSVLTLLGAVLFVTKDFDQVDLGPWTVVATTDSTGISTNVNEDAMTAPVSLRAIATSIHGRRSALLTATPQNFCNTSMPVLKDWGIRGPFNLSTNWDEKCHSEAFMPPNTWVWPGRNWCWVRTRTRSCYTHGKETQVPNWYWAQKAVARQGYAPQPELELLDAYVHPELCDLPELGLPWGVIPDEEKAAAAEWVNENIAIFVVNLPRDVERWQKMEARFRALGVRAHRLPGVDLTRPGALDRAQEEGVVPADYDYAVAVQNMNKIMVNSDNKGVEKELDQMGIGTVGCAAAHLRAQRLAYKLAGLAEKQMTLIMEDDVWLNDDALVKLRKIVTDELPCNWELFALTTRCGYGECVAPHVSRVQPDGNEPDVRCHNSGSYGMYGMLYRTGAIPKINDLLQKVCFDDARPACLPVDIAMASISDRIAYYAVPGSQFPGLAVEAGWGGSTRWAMNHPEEMDKAVRGKRKM